jgi:RNA polymerase sigma factor (TIGR02999 family)
MPTGDAHFPADNDFRAVYHELRKLAGQKLARERPGQTLEPTALVHEAYLRLVEGGAEREWNGRGHFFGAAATAMRRILIERARKKRRRIHGGGRKRQELRPDIVPASEPDQDLLALDAALTKLADRDPIKARLVELRYFAGLTGEQAAEILGISARTADRYWVYARAWLRREMDCTTLEEKIEKSPGAGDAISSH